MESQIVEETGDGLIRLYLKGSWTINHIEAAKEQLHTYLNRPEKISVHAADVEKADTSCIQLLLAFKNFRESSALDVAIDEPGEMIGQLIELYNLAGLRRSDDGSQ